jgi:hypothetical protein
MDCSTSSSPLSNSRQGVRVVLAEDTLAVLVVPGHQLDARLDTAEAGVGDSGIARGHHRVRIVRPQDRDAVGDHPP